MTPTDPRLQAALDAALNQIRATLTVVAGRVCEALGVSAQSSGRIAERELFRATQFEMRRNLGVFHRVFEQELVQRCDPAAVLHHGSKRKSAATDWQTLSLVDESEIEERMFSDRIGQQIAHVCDAELSELAAYMGALLNIGSADQERNPLRAEVLGAALYRAIEAVSADHDARKLLARELGAAVSKAMPECYDLIIRDLQDRGVQPVGLTVRQVEGPGNYLPGHDSGYATIGSTRGHGQHTDFDQPVSGRGPVTHLGDLPTQRGARGQRGGRSDPADPYGPASTSAGGYARTGTRTRSGIGSRSGPDSGSSGASSRSGLASIQADVQLMALLRQLTAGASQSGELDAAPRALGGALHSGVPSAAAGAFTRTSTGPPASDTGPLPSLAAGAEGITGLMAVNLIRAHREELMQAASGKLDHMVIDVVGSLFDQILADSRVPPQMARQIARLQLPVLRVALSDSSFFSSRRHPVRRFVNRIASLACAFDEFDEGPGKPFLDRVRELVQEIVDGDFDQIEIYSTKLAALESFIAEQTRTEAQHQGTAKTLGSKEAELRLQQRYMLQLQGALTPLALPPYLREFLPQVWSQALVLAVSRDGADSDRAKRYRRVGRDLVMSVQPKGLPALRKKFLMQLPTLMKDLNEGLALVGWPPAAQRDFLSQLLAAHAESLKGQPPSELDHNMMVKQLEGIFNMPVPGMESLSSADPVPDVDPEVIAKRFTPDEAKRVGLVTENAVDWSATVDIDLSAEADPDPPGISTQGGDSVTSSLTGIDIDLSLAFADPAEPTRGPQLIDHIQLGFAYQMHLKQAWQKVRLAHVSTGRSFFVFTRGAKHQETISMTARMVARMCETGRMRAFEPTYLMERATQRARKQLAALGAPTRG